MVLLTVFYVYLCTLVLLALVINAKSLTQWAMIKSTHPHAHRSSHEQTVATEYPNLVRLAQRD